MMGGGDYSGLSDTGASYWRLIDRDKANRGEKTTKKTFVIKPTLFERSHCFLLIQVLT